MTALALIILAYLLGSLPTGLLVIRLLKGVDIRTYGSGNIGATNVYRVAGLPIALFVLMVDALKGAAPVWLTVRWGQGAAVAVGAGLAAIAGHNWSPFLRFSGGKGIATSFGVLLALSPTAAGIAAGVWVVVLAATRYASLASLLAMASVPLALGWRREPREYVVFGVLALGLGIYRHRANISRLFHGTELRMTNRQV